MKIGSNRTVEYSNFNNHKMLMVSNIELTFIIIFINYFINQNNIGYQIEELPNEKPLKFLLYNRPNELNCFINSVI